MDSLISCEFCEKPWLFKKYESGMNKSSLASWLFCTCLYRNLSWTNQDFACFNQNPPSFHVVVLICRGLSLLPWLPGCCRCGLPSQVDTDVETEIASEFQIEERWCFGGYWWRNPRCDFADFCLQPGNGNSVNLNIISWILAICTFIPRILFVGSFRSCSVFRISIPVFLKTGRNLKGNDRLPTSKHPFPGAKMLVSGRVAPYF